MPPIFPAFTKPSLAHKPWFDKLFEAFPPYCDHTFSNLWSWDTRKTIKISTLNGNLVVQLSDYLTNEPFFSFLGKNKVLETVETLFDYLDTPSRHPDPAQPEKDLVSRDSSGRRPQNDEGGAFLPYLKLIPEDCLKGIDLSSKYKVTEDPDNFDYIYNAADLANISGNRYRGKKNFINRFHRLYQWEAKILDIKDDLIWEQMGQIFKLWSARQGEKDNDIENETKALLRLRDSEGVTKLISLGIFVDGKLAGYTINEINSSDFATNLFEHGNTDYVGIFPTLKQQTAKALLDLGCKFINHQQDLGLDGLRKSKQDWHPAFYLKKYTVKNTSL